MTSPLSSNLDVSSIPKTVVNLLLVQSLVSLLAPRYLPWRPNLSLDTSAFDFVLYSVEWQFRAKELEDLSFKILWNKGFEVENIEMGLIFDFPPNCGWKRGQLL
jgi:hypothetical protein